MTEPLTLALDASTYTSSVAVVRGNDVLAERSTLMRDVHSERLMPTVAEVLAAAGIQLADLERIVCGAGPGSFTSLRIAASIAKGLASGLRIPLHSVSSLLLIVAGSGLADKPGRYLAVLDAMRGEAFVAGYVVGPNREVAAASAPALIARGRVAIEAARLGARPAGPAEDLVAEPHARGVAVMGWSVEAVPMVELGSWEPSYGRVAEAQAKWEAAHGRPLPAA